MKNELRLLIEALQSEYDYLEAELNACITAWDFESAALFKEHLIETREKLYILKNLDHPRYDKMSSLKERITFISNLQSKEKYEEFVHQAMKDQVPALEKTLSDLENKTSTFHQDSDELIICLEKILQEEIRQFNLEIAEEKVVFEVSKAGADVQIFIRRTDKYSLRQTTTDAGLAELKRMGFLVNENTAVKTISEFQTHKILPTVELLARVSYDVFRLYGGKGANIILVDGGA